MWFFFWICDGRKEGRKEGRKDGTTDRGHFIGPFPSLLGGPKSRLKVTIFLADKLFRRRKFQLTATFSRRFFIRLFFYPTFLNRSFFRPIFCPMIFFINLIFKNAAFFIFLTIFDNKHRVTKYAKISEKWSVKKSAKSD